MATPSFSPQDRGVLVTGCSSGIGREVSLRLAQRGFTVFASVRKQADAEALRGLGQLNLVPLCPLDLTRREQIAAAAETVARELAQRGMQGLYALVNNAGGGGVAPIELMDLEQFHGELQARLLGPVALVQALLPLIRAGHGRLVWIVTPGLIPTSYVASIHACDFAANCLARTLDIELKPWKIPSIMVRCGGIKTERGLQTTAEVEALLQHPKSDLYREALLKWSKGMVEFDEKRTDPQKVAQAVERALCAPRPKRRYAVGYLSGAAAFLEALPQPLADALIAGRG